MLLSSFKQMIKSKKKLPHQLSSLSIFLTCVITCRNRFFEQHTSSNRRKHLLIMRKIGDFTTLIKSPANPSVTPYYYNCGKFILNIFESMKYL